MTGGHPTCVVCGAMFWDGPELDGHMDLSHPDSPYRSTDVPLWGA